MHEQKFVDTIGEDLVSELVDSIDLAYSEAELGATVSIPFALPMRVAKRYDTLLCSVIRKKWQEKTNLVPPHLHTTGTPVITEHIRYRPGKGRESKTVELIQTGSIVTRE